MSRNEVVFFLIGQVFMLIRRMSDIFKNIERPERFGFFLTPGFSLLAYSTLAEAFRIANEIAEREIYNWCTVAASPGALQAANNLTIVPDFLYNTGLSSDSLAFDSLAVCSSKNVHDFDDEGVFNWLRRLDRMGCSVGGITSGSWVLAHAGLLDGYRSTIHWQEMAAFRESFPELEVSDHLFELDRQRFTCAGGLAALDMILTMIGRRYGFHFAAQINERLIREHIRDPGEQTNLSSSARSAIGNDKLRTALEIMENNLETLVSIPDLAAKVFLSQRQLGRIFLKHLQYTPQQYYIRLRLDRAFHLLRQTALSISEISSATGFESQNQFGIAYKKRFGLSPSAERRKFSIV